MRLILMLLVLSLCSAPGPSRARDAEPVLKRSIPLPGVRGRIDHVAYDPVTRRLFVAALENGSLEVIDVEKGERVKSVSGLKEPQGVVFVPGNKDGSRVVVACGGDGTVRSYDAASFEEKLAVVVGEDADNVRLDVDGKKIAAGHGSGSVSFLDAVTLRTSEEISFSGHPESFQLEPGSQRVFINVPGGFVGGGGQVVVADRTTQKVTATWTLKEAGRNFPMALDSAHKRLYIGCRRPAKLLVIDTESGRVVAAPECVGDADEVFVDAKTSRVLVVGGDGAIDVFETKDQHAYTRLASVKTVSGARTGLLVAESHLLYVAVPKRSGHDAEIREYTLPD